MRSFASTPGWTQILDGVDPIQNNYQNDFAAGVVLVRASDGVNYGDMNQAGILGGLEEVVAATSGATYVLTLDTCGWVNNSVPGTIGYELYDPASSMTLASAPGVLFLDDWTFFFTAWELRGRYPAIILEHPKYGAAARELCADGKQKLDEIVKGKHIRASAVYGFWPAASEGNDIVLFTDETRSHELLRFPMLRQQGGEAPFRCLADFVAPRASGLADHVGSFAVTAGIGADELAKQYQDGRADYSSIIVKALADRLAEAFAEMLHAKVRREWGTAGQSGRGPARWCAGRPLAVSAVSGFVPG